MKKKLLMVLSLAMVAVMAVTGTMTYLTSTDQDVNVMTLGNVKIEQIEQEWNAAEDALVDFTQAKPIYPFVGEPSGWENKDADGGAYRRFVGENAVDKYVSVKNTGKSDAYVRTFIALEMGEISDINEYAKLVSASTNNENGTEFSGLDWIWTDDYVTEIDGNYYNIMVAVHKDPVKAGETTIPSLLQVYLKSAATNEDCDKIDGNNNGTFDILVFSEAVQAAGFDDAVTALDTAFYDAGTNAHPWGDGVEVPTTVNDEASLIAALADGESVILSEDITINEELVLNTNGAKIDLNGKTLTVGSLEVTKDATISNGNVKHGEIEYKDEYGFVYEGTSSLHVSSGVLTLNDVLIDCSVPCTLKINNNSSIEMVGLHVEGGAVVINDSKINIHNSQSYGDLIQYETLIGACIDNGELTMNNSSISFEGLGGRDSTEYLGMVARTDAVKVVNMNNTTIENALLYVACTGSNLTINTSDVESEWTGKYAGNITIEYDK